MSFFELLRFYYVMWGLLRGHDMTFTEIKQRVRPQDKQQLIIALADQIVARRLGVYYTYTTTDGAVHQSTSIFGFGPDVDFMNIEQVYTKRKK
jgi:hypothetical protein